MGRWLDIADLHERAGDAGAAALALRRVVDERLTRHDILGAAWLIEERLGAPDEALDLLLGAWPSSPQAASCLGEAFKLLARLGRHEAALERLAQLSRESAPDWLVLPLVATLGGTVREYPRERIRHRAADFSRILIARQLQRPALANDEAGRLLEHLIRLAPEDRLLSRDANRFLSERRGAQLRASRATPPPIPGNRPVVHHRFDLPRQIQWLELRREARWFYALGVTAKRLTLLRGTWEGQYQSLSWECPAEAVRQGFVFEPTRQQGTAVALARADGPPLPQQRFPIADQFFDQVCLAGTPSWLPTQGFPFAISDEVVWTVHLASGRAILSGHDKVHGNLLQTQDITDDLLSDAIRSSETRLSLAGLAHGAAVALGNRLVLPRGDGCFTRAELPGQVVRVFPSLPHTRQGVAIMLHSGAVMFWMGGEACLELDRDITSPIGAFVPGGPLVLASGARLLTLEVDSRSVSSVVRLELTGQRIVGVCPAANAGEFAVLSDNGQMTVYRMPR
jgi:tetratricopeptide (TPR) repeat protein